MSSNGHKNGPKVALISVGLGRVQRGFERWAGDLFEVLKDDIDITLYKSAGAVGPKTKVPPLLKPATAVARVLPLGKYGGSAEYHRDCIAFGLMLLPQLIRQRFDVINCVDPPLAVVLQHLKKAYGLSSQLLFTEGCVMPPEYYPRVDHIHHVSKASYLEALAQGVPSDFMTLVPCGIDVKRFLSSATRSELRRKNGISESTFVILAISAIKRTHKRVDYIIDEVSKLDGDVLLWLDGDPEEKEVVELAQQKLGNRCRITHVPSGEIGELYNLADVMVHASLEEAFGLAMAEAICTGLMVLAHNDPHFQWLIEEDQCLLDMRQPGALSARLHGLMSHRPLLERTQRAARARQRLEWRTVKSEYIEMYTRLAGIQMPLAAEAVGS